MVRQGVITEELRTGHLCKNILIRAVGLQDDIEIEYSTISLEPLEWFVLSTDGLHAILTNDEIVEVLSQSNTTSDACRQLIEATLTRDAPDNVTVICLRQI